MTRPPPYTVQRATTSNLPSLETIVPRAFHPTNRYITKLFPDTARVRSWWNHIFSSKVASPKISHLLTVTSPSDPATIFGVLSMQLFGPAERGAGFYSTFAPTPDHDAEGYEAVAANLAAARESYMSGKAHLVIELFGVDHGAKGLGLGKLLLDKACEIADGESLPIFVMANASAQGIYPKVGFELRDVKVMPGDLKYEEYMLVRPARQRGS